MNTSLSWIKAYVPELECSEQEYTDAMTLSGTKVEEFEKLDKKLEKIVVGQITKIERHPDADKLIVCQVNIGNESVQIVTGANNVNEGDKIPVVLDGGRVATSHGNEDPNGVKIKAGKLRGVPSQGMMCSIEELGSTCEMFPDAAVDGIYILPKETEVGADAIELLGFRDAVFEYEVTSNRVDCYGVLGIAREVAVTFRKEFIPPVVEFTENNERIEDYISVEVEDADLCSRYVARVCKNIKIGPSPEWMQRRLAKAGIRPINNLVDITNYVMEEYGQPMHAYDLATIANNKIIVKRAKDGDVFMTLDGVERKLDAEVLMICDGEKEVGIAGIMGGENSKITDTVDTVLLEAATFNGANIRKSSKRVGVRTDASGKFEKGLDPRNAEAAINRACQLIVDYCGGDVVSGMADVKAPLKELVKLPFEANKINGLLGTDITSEVMLDIFKRLEFVYDESTNMLIIPSFRQDVVGFADLAEEIARFYGYDKIPTTLPSGEATTGKLSYKLQIEEITKDLVEGYGFSQAMTYSFESPKVFDKLLLPSDAKEREAVTISNPLGEDFSIMRTVSLNGMLTSLATNYNRRNKDVKLYELGNIYLPKELPVTQLPDERMQLTLGFYGEGDFFDMKGVAETLLEKLGLRDKATYDPNNKKSYLHPGRQAEIIYNKVKIGDLGEVHPAVLDNYNIGTKAYICVLDMPSVVEFSRFDHKFEAISRFPAITRDISMTVSKDVMVGQIEEVITQRGGKILEKVELFDVYEGSQIAEGFKSVAYAISFRAKDRNLEDNDVAAAMKKILNGLEQIGAELRK